MWWSGLFEKRRYIFAEKLTRRFNFVNTILF